MPDPTASSKPGTGKRSRAFVASGTLAGRRAIAVAFVGADGAGKTTVARKMMDALPFPASYIYMGANLEAGNWMLPTSWLNRQWRRWRGSQHAGGGPPSRERPRRRRGPMQTLRSAKSALSLGHRILEQCFRHAVACMLRCRGQVVLFDRHYYTDYWAFDIDPQADRSWLQRIHGLVLEHVFPKPHLVIFLDAPSEVLLARKGEGTLELLNHRRQDYSRVADKFEHFVRIDASQPMERVVEEVADCIIDFSQGRP